MYQAYKVNLDDEKIKKLISGRDDGRDDKYQENNLNQIFDELDLENYINHDSLDMNKIQDTWFPNLKDYHVFLSHSRADKETVCQFANYLEKEFNIKCFIDSQLWGYNLKLQEKISNYHKSKNNIKDDDNIKNQSITHTNIILSLALIKMIYSCECFIFLETQNSTHKYQNSEKIYTHSPWINFELFLLNILLNKIKLNIPDRPENLQESSSTQEYINTEYLIDLSNLNEIDYEFFKNIGEKNSPKNFLDELYEYFSKKKSNNTKSPSTKSSSNMTFQKFLEEQGSYTNFIEYCEKQSSYMSFIEYLAEQKRTK